MVFVEHQRGLSASRGSLWLYQNGGKRGFDIMLSLLLMPIWLPLSALLWGLAVLETGTGSYVDLRVGRSGHVFKCLKIRTLHGDVSRRNAAEKPLLDPRATPFGCILRRASLDEVPQFWCVLKGEMSLVGPRPVPDSELKRYGAQRHAYLQMRPGMTGLWQVSGRNALSYERRIALDARYCRSVSFWVDLKILFATLREVARLSGR